MYFFFITETTLSGKQPTSTTASRTEKRRSQVHLKVRRNVRMTTTMAKTRTPVLDPVTVRLISPERRLPVAGTSQCRLQENLPSRHFLRKLLVCLKLFKLLLFSLLERTLKVWSLNYQTLIYFGLENRYIIVGCSYCFFQLVPPPAIDSGSSSAASNNSKLTPDMTAKAQKYCR